MLDRSYFFIWDRDQETFYQKETSNENEVDEIECTHCIFEAASENCLKVDMKRKHTGKSALGFPRLCDICDLKCKNNEDLKHT